MTGKAKSRQPAPASTTGLMVALTKPCERCGRPRESVLLRESGRPLFAPCSHCAEEVEAERRRAAEMARNRDMAARARSLLTAEGQSGLGIPPKYHGATVEDFEPGEQQETIAQVANGVVKLATFVGPRGTGKTRAAYACMRAWLARLQTVVLWSVPALVEELRMQAVQDAMRGTMLMRRLTKSEGLVILDDLGAEKPTEFSTQQLFIIIEEREKWERPTLVTTELKMAELAIRLADRIASRLSGGLVVRFRGPDRRLRGHDAGR